MTVRSGARRAAALVLVAAVWCSATACEVPIEDLGGFRSHLTAINVSSTVVGWSAVPGSTPELPKGRGFARTVDGTVTELSPLAGHDHSKPAAINDGGTVVGVSALYSVTSSGVLTTTGARAVRWDPDGTVTDLGTLAGDTTSAARAINRHGVVVGSSSSSRGTRPFVVDPAVGTMVALPNPPGGTASVAHAINDGGIVLGTADFMFSGFYTGTPVMWDLNTGTVTNLRSTTGLSTAVDINNDGVIAGAVEVVWDSGFAHALVPAVWIPGEGLVYPSPPPAGATIASAPSAALGSDHIVAPDPDRSGSGEATTNAIIVPWSAYAEARAVNDRGEVIVHGSFLDGTAGDFRWTHDTGLRSVDPGVELWAVSETGVFAGALNDKAAVVFPDL